jgi:hypothetical protein
MIDITGKRTRVKYLGDPGALPGSEFNQCLASIAISGEPSESAVEVRLKGLI